MLHYPRAALDLPFYGSAPGVKVVRGAGEREQSASTLTLLASPRFLPL